MTTISFNSRIKPDQDDKVFTYSHNAKSWLILAGYLPTEDNHRIFVNVYTAEIATLKVTR